VNNEHIEHIIDDVVRDDATEFKPRRIVYKRPKTTLFSIVKWLLNPLKPATPPSNLKQKQFRSSKEWPLNSRYGAKRRAKRIRLRNQLLTIKYSKRIGVTIFGIIMVGMLAFWAKFALVYNLPAYVQVGSLQNVQAYVVYKSWWFGPPSFNLSDYHNIDPDNPELSLIIQLDRYRDIITNSNEIIYVFPKNTNNNNN